jgi:AraC-like DNA-binding protein
MEWATTIFPLEYRSEPSDFVERIWRTRGVPETAMISVAVPHWQIVVVEHSRGPRSVLVRGPETKASIVEIPQEAEFLGIEFKLGTFIPALAAETLVDVGRPLAAVSRTRVNLAGSSWEIPNFENAHDFVTQLARDGALVRDSVVQQVLLREPLAITERSVQRRFLRATGLSYGTVRQIERAERTVALLTAGTSIADAIEIAGYSDQAHMTRSLQRFLGKTPARVVSSKP